MSKQEVSEIINSLPDTVSFGEVIYSLYVANSIKKGLSDIEDGTTYLHE